MTGEAIRPSSFFSSLPTALRDDEDKKVAPSDEEVMLHSLSTHTGWKVLSEYIDTLLSELDTGTDLAMKQGLPFEEIGRNAVVINLAKSIIRKIQNKVEDAREAIEKDGSEQ